MNTVESQVQHIFYEEGILVTCTDRPDYNNPFGLNKTIYGLEVHKKDVDFVAEQLTKLGINHTVRDGKFLNTKYCWTNKSFNFIEVPNHKEAYHIIVEGGIL